MNQLQTKSCKKYTKEEGCQKTEPVICQVVGALSYVSITLYFMHNCK